MSRGSAERPREYFNEPDQEVPDNRSYAAIVKSVVEILQSANFLGPVESNNGFTVMGVPVTGGGGAVDSVNGETGVVLLDSDDVPEGDTNLYNATHTGDVTGAIALVIAADVVTNAKLADMVAGRLKGRITTDGDPQDLTAAQVRALLNVADGANAYVHPNHSGDVVSTGDGATAIQSNTITNGMLQSNAVTAVKLSNNAVTTAKISEANVTNAKLANMAQSTLKGRAAGAGTGVPTDLTMLEARAVLRGATTEASNATPSINADDVAYHSITALTVAITGVTVTGTPTEGQTLWIAITGTAARAITWGSQFESSTITLPTTTVTTARLDVGFVYNSATSKWRCVALA